MSETIPLLVNGIFTRPQDPKGWVTRAIAWGVEHRIAADSSQYWCDAALKTLWQNHFVAELLGKIKPGGVYRLIGHSNGCDIICEALGYLLRFPDGERIDEVHLIAAAVEHDFDRNFLNDALAANLVGRVFIYASEEDYVLRFLARGTRGLLGRVGYGYLGYQAAVDHLPLHIDAAVLVLNRVEIVTAPRGHSEWFQGAHFDALMPPLFHGLGDVPA